MISVVAAVRGNPFASPQATSVRAHQRQMTKHESLCCCASLRLLFSPPFTQIQVPTSNDRQLYYKSPLGIVQTFGRSERPVASCRVGGARRTTCATTLNKKEEEEEEELVRAQRTQRRANNRAIRSLKLATSGVRARANKTRAPTFVPHQKSNQTERTIIQVCQAALMPSEANNNFNELARADRPRYPSFDLTAGPE